MRKKCLKTGAALTIGAGLLFSPTAAIATETDVIIEDRMSAFSKEFDGAKVKIYTVEGSEEYTVTEKVTFGEFLEKHSFNVENFKTIDGKEIDTSQTIDKSYSLVKTDIDTKNEIIKLKAPTKKVKTDKLYKGETNVKQEGKDGKALKTTFTSYSPESFNEVKEKSKDNESKLTILKSPVEEIIEVGTKEQEEEPETTEDGLVEYDTNENYVGTGVMDTTPVTRTDPSDTSNGNINDIISLTSTGNSIVNIHTNSDKIPGSYAGGPATYNPAPNNAKGNKIIEDALKYVGYPYVWSANGPNAFDCSGFTQYIYKKNGISLPRMSGHQGRSGVPVSLAQAKPGDLVVWTGHVALYMGDGRIIHAANPSVGVTTGKIYGNYQIVRIVK